MNDQEDGLLRSKGGKPISRTTLDDHKKAVDQKIEKYERFQDRISDSYSTLMFAIFAFLAGGFFTTSGSIKIVIMLFIVMQIVALLIFLLYLSIKGFDAIREARNLIEQFDEVYLENPRLSSDTPSTRNTFFTVNIRSGFLLNFSVIMTMAVTIGLITLGLKV